MGSPLLLLLLIVSCSSVLAAPGDHEHTIRYHAGCSKCQEITPMKDFNEDKVI